MEGGSRGVRGGIRRAGWFAGLVCWEWLGVVRMGAWFGGKLRKSIGEPTRVGVRAWEGG